MGNPQCYINGYDHMKLKKRKPTLKAIDPGGDDETLREFTVP